MIHVQWQHFPRTLWRTCSHLLRHTPSVRHHHHMCHSFYPFSLVQSNRPGPLSSPGMRDLSPACCAWLSVLLRYGKERTVLSITGRASSRIAAMAPDISSTTPTCNVSTAVKTLVAGCFCQSFLTFTMIPTSSPSHISPS